MTKSQHYAKLTREKYEFTHNDIRQALVEFVNRSVIKPSTNLKPTQFEIYGPDEDDTPHSTVATLIFELEEEATS